MIKNTSIWKKNINFLEVRFMLEGNTLMKYQFSEIKYNLNPAM